MEHDWPRTAQSCRKSQSIQPKDKKAKLVFNLEWDADIPRTRQREEHAYFNVFA